MALIKCSECAKEISDKAEICPSCGNPIHAQAVEVQGKVEIERTNKRWKKKRLWGVLILIIGFFTIFSSIGWGILLMMIGFGTIFVSEIGAWWSNG